MSAFPIRSALCAVALSVLNPFSVVAKPRGSLCLEGSAERLVQSGLLQNNVGRPVADPQCAGTAVAFQNAGGLQRFADRIGKPTARAYYFDFDEHPSNGKQETYLRAEDVERTVEACRRHLQTKGAQAAKDPNSWEGYLPFDIVLSKRQFAVLSDGGTIATIMQALKDELRTPQDALDPEKLAPIVRRGLRSGREVVVWDADGDPATVDDAYALTAKAHAVLQQDIEQTVHAWRVQDTAEARAQARAKADADAKASTSPSPEPEAETPTDHPTQSASHDSDRPSPDPDSTNPWPWLVGCIVLLGIGIVGHRRGWWRGVAAFVRARATAFHTKMKAVAPSDPEPIDPNPKTVVSVPPVSVRRETIVEGAAPPASSETDAQKFVSPFIGQTIDARYHVEAELGAGGMGTVYKATQLSIGRPVAFKIMLSHSSETDTSHPIPRFEREAQTLAMVHHPHVVMIHDFGRMENGALFLVMEYVEGKTLKKVLKEKQRLAPRRAVHIIRQLLLGLEAIHAAHLMHRDLKPDNIILAQVNGDPDFVKLVDFGLAKPVIDPNPLTIAGMMVGTPQYLAPEMIHLPNQPPMDHRADLYQVGVILYELLTGKLPIMADNSFGYVVKIANEPPDLLNAPEGAAPFPEALVRLVMSALEKDPDQRPASATAFIAALDAIDWSAVSEDDAALHAADDERIVIEPIEKTETMSLTQHIAVDQLRAATVAWQLDPAPAITIAWQPPIFETVLLQMGVLKVVQGGDGS